MRLQITTFAQLKDYFEPSFTVEVEENGKVEDALLVLARLCPDAKSVLEASRVAINEEIVALKTPLEDGQSLFILPPASGG